MELLVLGVKAVNGHDAGFNQSAQSLGSLSDLSLLDICIFTWHECLQEISRDAISGLEESVDVVIAEVQDRPLPPKNIYTRSHTESR